MVLRLLPIMLGTHVVTHLVIINTNNSRKGCFDLGITLSSTLELASAAWAASTSALAELFAAIAASRSRWLRAFIFTKAPHGSGQTAYSISGYWPWQLRSCCIDPIGISWSSMENNN
jgi:hypothetical protein